MVFATSDHLAVSNRQIRPPKFSFDFTVYTLLISGLNSSFAVGSAERCGSRGGRLRPPLFLLHYNNYPSPPIAVGDIWSRKLRHRLYTKRWTIRSSLYLAEQFVRSDVDYVTKWARGGTFRSPLMQCWAIPLTKAQHWVCGWFGVTIPPSAVKWHTGATNRQRGEMVAFIVYITNLDRGTKWNILYFWVME